MNDLLNRAIEAHKLLTGETVTKTAAATALFAAKNPKTQRVNLHNLTSGKTRLNANHIMTLTALFPETDAVYWIGAVDWDHLRASFSEKFTIDDLDTNPELAQLFEMIQNKQYSRNLIKKYKL